MKASWSTSTATSSFTVATSGVSSPTALVGLHGGPKPPVVRGRFRGVDRESADTSPRAARLQSARDPTTPPAYAPLITRLKRGVSGTRNKAPSKRDVRPPVAPPDTPGPSLNRIDTATWENGTLRRGVEYQMPGVVCPDCRRVAAFGWCMSDRHPTFDDRGYLVRMTPLARGSA